jgi:hypothetical protein
MKKMKITLAATVALAACASTQLFAQNIKIDNITMALTILQQASVSTSTVANAGNFSQGPTHYKTTTFKMTQVDILKAISYVMHPGNAGFYSSKAVLQLVQGELGGFWNITDAVAQSYADLDDDGNNSLPGTFNQSGTDTTFYDASFVVGTDGYADSTSGDAADFPIIFPDPYIGVLDNAANNFEDFATSLFNSDEIDMANGPIAGGTYARLDTGRHFLPVPWENSSTSTPYPTTGEYPVGHLQPWGQIFVKDTGGSGESVDSPLCENVTFFFCITVEECYDCFYLNSFISDATFTTKSGTQAGPPCCSAPNFLLGKGTDKYYMSLSFDNTQANPYLNPATEIIPDDDTIFFYNYVGHTGIAASIGVADGLTPDLLVYSDPIRSGLGSPSPYETRFTLNGIVQYNWTLELLNPNDAAADYVGTATYAANGYGFIHLVCSLLTGTATFSEKVVKDIGCCDDSPWFESWYGPGADFGPTGAYQGTEEGFGYYNPENDQYDPYPYFNIVGGAEYSTNFSRTLPDQFESPYNPGPALANHHVFQCCGAKIGFNVVE